jgi:hypothetical protein
MRIRRRRHQQRRVVVGSILAGFVLLILPIYLRLPIGIDEAITLKSSANFSLDCQNLGIDFIPRIEKGSGNGIYNLDHPLGVLLQLGNTSVPTAIPTWSQYRQDLWVDSYFGQKTKGIFVEIGGFDGETHSNTLLFERKGWQGILIEANPYSFEIMNTKGRSCWMAHACIKTKRFQQMHFKLAGGITSALEIASPNHRERIQHDIQQYGQQGNWKGAGETYCLPCSSFESILGATSLWTPGSNTTIDYFSLDVEGAELELLEIILEENTVLPKIHLFTIEMQENSLAIRRFMADKNYQEVATVGIDSVFVLKD